MTCPQYSQETRDGLRAICVAIFFIISLALCSLFYWNSWQWWASNDWPWHVLACCAPLFAAIWLGACEPTLQPRRCVLHGLFAGAGGFLLQLLICGSYKNQFLPPKWPLSLSAFVLAGAFLCPLGYFIGRRLLGRRLHSEPGVTLIAGHGHAHSRPHPPYWIYIQTALGFIGPIIVAVINHKP
jgi:hypothetical protein